MMTSSQQCGSSAKGGLVHELTLQGGLDKYELSLVFEISVSTLPSSQKVIEEGGNT